MIGWAIEIGLGVLLAFLIANAIHWAFWPVALVVAITMAYFHYHRRQRRLHPAGGGAGHAAPAGHHGGGGGDHTNRLIMLAIAVGVMMILNFVTGVSTNYAMRSFYHLGWRFWLWPARVGMPIDLLLWVAVFGAILTPRRLLGAKVLFAITAFVFFFVLNTPRFFNEVRPKPDTPVTLSPGETQVRAETDQALADNGAIGAGVGSLWRAAFGKSHPIDATVSGVKNFAKQFVPTTYASAAPQAAPTEKPWAWQTLDIPEGGLNVHLYPGWATKEIVGGDIIITNPDGKEIKDGPSYNNHLGQQVEGDYTIRPDGDGSRTVSVKNRWQ